MKAAFFRYRICVPMLRAAIGLFGACYVSMPAQGDWVDFDDRPLAYNSYYNGADGAGAFVSGGAAFGNIYMPEYETWLGWSHSSMTDSVTAGPGNQYSAITGAGANGSSSYGVAYLGVDNQHPEPFYASDGRITLPAGQQPVGMYVTNTTYAVRSMEQGDQFARKFGDDDGEYPDWFLLTVDSVNASGGLVNSVNFYLADYRFDDGSRDYIVDDWQWIDLLSLQGPGVVALTFQLDSSDFGYYGMNTPAYFAMDQLQLGTFLPQPSIEGDLNGDNMVNGADVARLASYFGMTNATWRHGDLNGDRQVDLIDLGWMQTRLGMVAPSPAAAMPVPEPAAGTLACVVAFGGGLVLLRRRRGFFPEALVVLVTATACVAQAGPYADPGIPGRVPDPLLPGATIVNPEFGAWASGVVRYEPSPGILAPHDDPTKATGPVGVSTGGQTVSLGDLSAEEIDAGVPPGSITLRFDQPFRDRQGWDFAAFENAFRFFPPDDDKMFAELGYVEVSSDGTTFARFPSVSLTTEADLFTPFGRAFAGIDPTDVHNLAGRHEELLGTPFDLAELTGLPAVQSGAVDLNRIQFVRIVDIPGNGAFADSLGNPILDTWNTRDAFGNGGLDLDAVGARFVVPEPGALAYVFTSLMFVAALRYRRNEIG
jgi:hypothetical protein